MQEGRRMKCEKCFEDFEEKEIEVSHDIPKYLGGTDKDGRHNLCKKHHKDYDDLILKECLKSVGEEFNEEERISWMIELSKQREDLKIEFRSIARKWCDDFFKGVKDGKGI
jgi:hypothetical protein